MSHASNLFTINRDPVTVESLMETFMNEGILEIHVQNGRLLSKSDNYLSNHYGESEDSLPCDAEVITFQLGVDISLDVYDYLESLLDFAKHDSKAVLDNYDTAVEEKLAMPIITKKEIIASDISDDYVVRNTDIKVAPTRKLHEFTVAEKLIYAINHAGHTKTGRISEKVTVFWLLKKYKEAVALSAPIFRVNSDGDAVLYRAITQDELASIKRVVDIRIASIATSEAIRKWENAIISADSHEKLKKIGQWIAKDKRINEGSAKKHLRGCFKRRDYVLSAASNWVIPMLTKKTKVFSSTPAKA